MTHSNISIAALVFGIISIVFIFVPVIGQICMLTAIILGFFAMRDIKEHKLEGRGFAIAGIVLGIITLILSLLIFAGIIYFFSHLDYDDSNDPFYHIIISQIPENDTTIIEVCNNETYNMEVSYQACIQDLCSWDYTVVKAGSCNQTRTLKANINDTSVEFEDAWETYDYD